MPCIVTSSGVLVDLVNPHPDTIRLYDISRSVSRQPMVCGHTSRRYSVAENALLVCEILDKELQVKDPSMLIAGLLSNAAWAYMEAPEHGHHEGALRNAIHARFGVVTAWASGHATLQRAQAIADATVCRDLRGLTSTEAEPSKSIRLSDPAREHITDAEWEGLYVSHMNHLMTMRAALTASVKRQAASA